MKRGSTMFLKGVVIFIGLFVLGLCIFAIPPVISSDHTGYYRPILLGLYVTAVPFFLALYQATNLLGLIDKNQAFSDLSIKALKNIKYCAITIGALFIVGTPYIYMAQQQVDPPIISAMAFVITFASFVIATFAAVLQKLVQNAVDIKSENDLTV